jgi:DegV family protein with EDD domain
MRTAIVTDSTADIPQAWVEKFDIHVVPAVLMMGEQSYEDGKGLTRHEFYELLPKMNPLPTTGTPSAGVFEKIYQNIFDHGYHRIISIHVASKLSGIFSTASLAAKNFDNRVLTVDSESLSMGIGFQVITAIEAATENAAIETIINRIETTRRKTTLLAMLDTLEYVHRSGRVGWAQARIGSLLRIKPFVEVKAGKVVNLGQTRTRKKGISHLKSLLKAQGILTHLAILHTNAEKEAVDFLGDLEQDVPADTIIVNVTTIIGTHVGPNGLGFAAVRK